MKFPIKLLDDLVCIKPNNEDSGKIKLPDWRKSLQGKVIAKGAGCQELKTGDQVIFGAAVGMESIFNGFTVRIMRESDVEAITS